MKKETKKKALINSLVISKLHSSNKDELSDSINELKDEYGFKIEEIMEESGLSRSSIYSYLDGKPKLDKTQVTNRILTKDYKNLDFDILIRHFRTYSPSSSEERNKIGKLIAVLMDCVKR